MEVGDIFIVKYERCKYPEARYTIIRIQDINIISSTNDPLIYYKRENNDCVCMYCKSYNLRINQLPDGSNCFIGISNIEIVETKLQHERIKKLDILDT